MATKESKLADTKLRNARNRVRRLEGKDWGPVGTSGNEKKRAEYQACVAKLEEAEAARAALST